VSTPEEKREFWQRVAADWKTDCGIERARADAAESQRDALLAALQALYTECDAWQHEELDQHETWGPIMRAASAAIAACEVQS
jgi:hypothetical protein